MMATEQPAPGPTERCTYHGATMDEKTKAFLQVLERQLGYELTITKGCYLPEDGNSARTHVGGGVVDLAPFDYKRKVRKARDLGAAAWYRPRIPGLWEPHIHLVIIGHQTLSDGPDGAQAQVVKYLAGEDGFAGHNADPNPYRPNPLRRFSYTAALRDARLRDRITGLRARINTLRDRLSYR